MTRIWNLTEVFPNKVNFIDSNNVVLGYDLRQNCCEDAFWTISESKDGSNPIYKGENDSEPQEIELKDYFFDPIFYEKEIIENSHDEDNVAIFRLINYSYNDKKPDLYIRLENHHNGYYSHGFTFRGKVIIQDGL